MPKVVAIIPARWGSTRFPGKPLHVIAGKPLIQHVWERTCRATSLRGVVIATDDMRIAEAAFHFGAEVSLTSSAHKSGTDRVAEVAKKLPSDITHVINVQGDEPLVEPALIDRMVKILTKDPRLTMVTAANDFAPRENLNNPHAVKVVLDRESNALYFSRSVIPFSQDKRFPASYFRHQGLYGYSRKFLVQFIQWKPSPLEKAEQLEQLRALENGAKIRVLITNSASVGVDTPEDVKSVAAILKIS